MSARLARGPRAVRWQLAVWLLWLVLGMVMAVSRGSMAVLAAAVISLGTCVTADVLGWRLAAALSLLSALVLQTYLLNLTPLLDIPIETASIAVWSVTGAGLLFTLVRRGFPAMVAGQRWLLSTALIVPVTGASASAALWLHRHGHWIGWAMNGDTAYRTRATLGLVQDKGILTHGAPPDPLTSVINATWGAHATSPGTSGTLGTQLLHMVTTSEQAWILVWLTVSFTVAIIAQRRDSWSAARLGAILLALVPWTWFMAGLAASYGFQNVGPTVLVLLLTYVVAWSSFRHPVAGVTGLIMATVAAVMAWAPLAAYPAAWLLVTGWRSRHALRRSGRLCLFPVAALVAALTYASLVTLPGLRSQSISALSNDGAIPALSRTAGVAVVLCLVALAWRSRERHPQNWVLIVAATLAGLFVLLGLMAQRRHSPSLWGYYPIKFAWISLAVALLIAAATAISSLGPSDVRGLRTWLKPLAALVTVTVTITITVYAMALLSPPQSNDPAWLFAPEALRTNTVNERPAEQLLAILDRHPKSFVTRYNVGPSG